MDISCARRAELKVVTMRIFLDVGAHVGETLEEVCKPLYQFDRIVAFEPSAICLPALEKFAENDPRVEICSAGLSNRNAELPLYHAGSLAGSVVGVLENRTDVGATVESVKLIKAGDWMRENTTEADLIVMKINCEGSEVDVVENLLDTGMLERIYVLLISWDIRMYPGGLAREKGLRHRLNKAGVNNFCSSDDIMIGRTHGKRIAHWLGKYGLADPSCSPAELRRKYEAAFRQYAAKSGAWHRFEHSLKQTISYDSFPAPVQRLLQKLKAMTSLNRERDLL